MKKILLIIILMISYCFFVSNAFADDSSYSYYSNKTIKKICKYSRDQRNLFNSNGEDSKYLYIYTDGTASIGWNASGCARTNNNGKCADGYKKGDNKYPGIMNWSKVKTNDGTYGAEDAYSYYDETGECPGYLGQSQHWEHNYFFLSNGASAVSLKDIKKATEKIEGRDKYYYYNIDDSFSSFKLDNDLTCNYNTSNGVKTVITFSKDGDISVSNNLLVSLSKKMFSSMYLNMLEDNKCPKSLDSCKGKTSALGQGTIDVYMIYGDSSVATTFCGQNDVVTFECEGDNCSTQSVCQLYSDYESQLRNDLKNYPTDSSAENIKIIEQYNEHKDQFNEYCKSVLKTLDYSEGNCIDSCLTLAKDLADLEAEKGLRSSNLNQKCNIGESIVNMLYNVLKWAKYIAPALVIILTMLDFIKAIAAQNDDDMKKAQGKFVKRLIIAALLFLLPLIINFVLQTFGMYNSSCDITDIF